MGNTQSFGMKQSWTVFMWFFILSGLENSFWHTGQGNTFLWWPSWYKNAWRWKLYLFLNVFCMSTLAHSVQWYTPSLMDAYLNRFSPRTDISVSCSAGSWLWDVALRRTLLFTAWRPDGGVILFVLLTALVDDVVGLLLFMLSGLFICTFVSELVDGDCVSGSSFGVNICCAFESMEIKTI